MTIISVVQCPATMRCAVGPVCSQMALLEVNNSKTVPHSWWTLSYRVHNCWPWLYPGQVSTASHMAEGDAYLLHGTCHITGLTVYQQWCYLFCGWHTETRPVDNTSEITRITNVQLFQCSLDLQLCTSLFSSFFLYLPKQIRVPLLVETGLEVLTVIDSNFS